MAIGIWVAPTPEISTRNWARADDTGALAPIASQAEPPSSRRQAERREGIAAGESKRDMGRIKADRRGETPPIVPWLAAEFATPAP
jgi:hypothetical protein